MTTPPGWTCHPLREIAEVFDGPHATPDKTDSGPIFLGISNLARGRLDLSDTEHLSDEDFERWTRRVTPQAGDVVFSYETRLGEAAFIPHGLRCCLGRRMGLLRARCQKVDPRFLLYAYLGPAFQQLLQSRTIHGSTVDRIPLTDMPEFPICIPCDLSEQRAIANILGTLDDKIELNRRMNETLEAIARAIFNRSFSASEQDYVEASHLISQGVLQIGDGYRAKNEELGDEGLPFIRASNLNNGFDTESAERLRPESVAKAGPKLGKVGDVAFTSKGTIGRFARVGEGTDPFVYSPQVCYWRSLDPQTLQPIVLYCWMNTADFKRQIDAVAGQTDMAPYVSLQDQRRFKVPRFSDSQHEIALCLAPLVAKQSLNTVESRSLVTLRDAVLPKLISGEIRVNDGENAEVEVR